MHITTFVNAKMASILGYTEDEIIGHSIFEFMFEKDIPIFHEEHELRQQGIPSAYELRLRSKQNTEVWTHINGSPLYDKGKFIGSLGMVSDITKHKIKEWQRDDDQRRYKSLFEDSPVPIWEEDFSEIKKYIDRIKATGVTDIRGYFEANPDAVVECSALMIVIDVNRAVVELNEAESKEYMLENFSKLVDSKSAEYAINQFEAIANGEPSCEFDAELRTFGNKKRHVHLKWSVVKGYEETYEKVYLSTTDLTERIITENNLLKSSNDQKELLLKEIHHRVKNNLQIIVSLLKLQTNSIEDPKTIELFELSLHRINSMALVHELLYRSKDFSQIDYGSYLQTLIAPLVDSMRGIHSKINLEIDVKNITLNINTSIPLGLLINEIVTNSLKHGFPNGMHGLVSIRISPCEYPNFILEIKDDGVGYPEVVSLENAETLGLQLISSLADQLMGEVERVYSERGTHYKIHFEELQQKPAISGF